MNRDDLLKKCVDRGVADEGSVEAVSHLFYMYLLTALQKGQRVEVPRFGTFGTRVVGVKKTRKMPFFEVEKELADRVNARYRELKYLVVGRYELIPVLADEEYKGKDVPPEVAAESLGKEVVLDPHRDVTIEEFERTHAMLHGTATSKEKAMPKLNLKDEGIEEGLHLTEGEDSRAHAGPILHDSEPEPGSKRPSVILQVLIALLIVGALTFVLNYFGVINIWGSKAPVTTETLPEPEFIPPVQERAPDTIEPTPAPATEMTPPAAPPATAATAPKTPPVSTPVTPPASPPKTTLPASSAEGRFTVQVSSWHTPAKANAEAARLSGLGHDAFVVEAKVFGETRYRVRIGRYATEGEAADVAARLRQSMGNGFWVARLN